MLSRQAVSRVAARMSSVKIDMMPHGVASLAFNAPPVNTLNKQLLSDIKTSVDQVVADGASAIVFSSAKPGVFSSGLDIFSMYGKSDDELREFWQHVQDMWLSVYMCPIPTIAAINGASPAGGCQIAMSCDYRIMAKHPKIVIGLNETALGIVAPTWFVDTMVNTIGQRETEFALQLGHLYSGERALEIGLIDELVEPDDMMERVIENLKLWLKVPPKARAITKQLLRQDTANKLISKKEQDIETFVKLVSQPSVQKDLGRYIEMMKAKSKK
ncbi:unnamed protein product [Oikopleura dioica]|uniref:Enoyl-CoA delta isomerase 1, mitochondrial n=1 Tax=Oikopleura dioica TaxID=34765 RepID=E4YQR7_OIKDI|nr:unnamed protein product [Oikopleura dioica]